MAKLFNEEFHVIVRPDVTDIRELDGKVVNFGDEGSGTNITGRLIFAALGVNVQKSQVSDIDAIEKLKSGEIAAAIVMGGSPCRRWPICERRTA